MGQMRRSITRSLSGLASRSLFFRRPRYEQNGEYWALVLDSYHNFEKEASPHLPTSNTVTYNRKK